MAFDDIIFILFGAVVGFAGGWFVARRAPRQEDNNLEDHNLQRRRAKEEHKAKILELLEERGEVTNDMVQEVLGVSDASSTNYLQELEQQGRIEQLDPIGRGVKYRLKNG